jgi:lipase chaperone LimK
VVHRVGIFALGALLAVVAGFWLFADGGQGLPGAGIENVGQQTAGRSVALPEEVAGSSSAEDSVPPLPRDERISDIDVDGSVRVDMNGNLVLDPSLRRFLDFYIGLTGDQVHGEALRQRLAAEMRQRGISAQVQLEVLEILDDYLAYRGASEALAVRRSGNVEDLQAVLDELKDLRRKHLGPDVAEGFFGAEEARLRLMLDRQRILADESLSGHERDQALAQVDQLLPEFSVQTRRRSEAVVSTSLKVSEMREQGASEEEVRAVRLEAYGPEATQRLSRLDEQRAQWQSRVAEYRRQKALIDQAGGLTAEDRQAEVEALRVRMFETEHERRRISALDRAGDDCA